MKPRLVPIQLTDKKVLQNLMTMYFHDLSEFTGDDVNPHGQYDYRYLDHYWTEEGRHPFFLKVNGQFAGFALVREIGQADQRIYSMAEFFVMRKYRGQGIAKQSVFELFTRFRGQWHVAADEQNIPAQGFWRHVIGYYTRGNVREVRDAAWNGPIQRFSTENV
ncbi:MAG: GNAT family N-acetyltransferase [Ardenticatenaceae bacterium]